MRDSVGFNKEQVKHIKSNYPAFIKDVKAFLIEMPKANIEETISKAPDNVKQGIDTLVDMMLEACFRDLYDFFDEAGVQICVYPDCDENGDLVYGSYWINKQEDNVATPFIAKDRTESERLIFLEVIRIYEEQNKTMNV